MKMDKEAAQNSIIEFFSTHSACMKETLDKSTGGKIYELFCLAKTLEWLRKTYGVSIHLVNGTTVNFKASPGNIDRSRSYFEVGKGGDVLELHTDIQVRTLGASIVGGRTGKSGYHEIDLVLIDPSVPNGEMPRHSDLFLGVECKSQENFEKSVLKQVLGIRRELSRLWSPLVSKLEHLFGPVMHFGTSSPTVHANPASLYWIAYIDPKGDEYRISPSAFSIEFNHWQP